MRKVGTKFVMPMYGVAVIKRIETKDVGGKKKDFYVCSVVQSQMTVLAPVDQFEQLGYRDLLPPEKLRMILPKVLDARPALDQQSWNARYREYMEKIKTGSILQIALVYRNLHQLRREKDLSFGERKMCDQANNLLVMEMEASGMEAAEIAALCHASIIAAWATEERNLKAIARIE